MAKDREAIEKQIADLQAELEAGDDDDEVWVEHPKTKAVGKLRGNSAKRFLAGILGDDDDQDDDDQDDDDQDDDDPPAKKTDRKRTAKKTGDRQDAPPARQSVWGRR